MAITLTIGGVDRTDYLGVNTGRITRDINGRATFNGVLRQAQRGYTPTKGSAIVISQDGTKRFGGFIMSIRTKDAGGSRNLMEYAIRCVDWNHIANRRLVYATFEGGQTVAEIATYIVDNVLYADGVTIGSITSSTVITNPISFRYETATSCLNKLCAISGDLWAINFDKQLSLGPFSPNPAPFSVTDATGATPEGLSGWFDLETEKDDSAYRNRQYVRTEAQLGLMFGESYTVAVNGQDFIPTATAPTETPTVTINGSPATVSEYVLGTPPTPGFDFYWTRDWVGIFTYGWAVGDPTQGITLNAGDVIGSDYRGEGRNVVMVEDTAEQIARAALDGTSGIWEAIEEQKHIEYATTLEAIGNGRLRQFGSDILKATFKTDWEGVEPGQRITVNVPRYGVNQSLLIERVDSEWLVARTTDFLRHTVTCTSQEPAADGSGGARPEAYMSKVVEMARIGQTPAQLAEEAEADISSSGPMLTFVFEDPELAVADASRNWPELAIGDDRLWHPTKWHVTAVTAPQGGSPANTAIEFQVFYSTDDGANWTMLFEGWLDDGDHANDGLMEDFSPAVDVDLENGTLFKASITQVGTTTPGGGLTIQVEGDLV